MTVLVGWSLKEADRREVAVIDCGVEIQQIVLMVGWAIIPDFSEALGTGVIRVRGRGPVVEEGVVRNVVRPSFPPDQPSS